MTCFWALLVFDDAFGDIEIFEDVFLSKIDKFININYNIKTKAKTLTILH